MLTKDTIYGKDLGNHNFLHYINFLSQKTRNSDRFGSCSFSIQDLLIHSNWHRKADSNEGTARGHHSYISCTCRSWRDDVVALEIGPALLRLLAGCSTETAWDWLTVIIWTASVALAGKRAIHFLESSLPTSLWALWSSASRSCAVQTEKFFLFFFCLNRVGIKVDSKWINLQNCQIHVKPTTWQWTGHSFSYSRSHGMLMKVRLLILTVWDKIQNPLFSASFKLFPELSVTSWSSFLHVLSTVACMMPWEMTDS